MLCQALLNIFRPGWYPPSCIRGRDRRRGVFTPEPCIWPAWRTGMLLMKSHSLRRISVISFSGIRILDVFLRTKIHCRQKCQSRQSSAGKILAFRDLLRSFSDLCFSQRISSSRIRGGTSGLLALLMVSRNRPDSWSTFTAVWIKATR
jgi:hypothetical protein